MNKNFASRKFLLFLISICSVALGWFYSLVYKTDLLATVSTLWMSMLAAYSGANLMDYKLNPKAPEAPKSQTPPASGPAEAAKGEPK